MNLDLARTIRDYLASEFADVITAIDIDAPPAANAALVIHCGGRGQLRMSRADRLIWFEDVLWDIRHGQL